MMARPGVPSRQNQARPRRFVAQSTQESSIAVENVVRPPETPTSRNALAARPSPGAHTPTSTPARTLPTMFTPMIAIHEETPANLARGPETT